MSERKQKWQLIALAELTSIGSGSGFPTKYQGELEQEYPFYKVSDMNSVGNEVVMTTHQHSISEQVLKELKAKLHPEKTIIFPKIGAAIATNKKRILGVPSCFDNNVIGIHPTDAIDTRYLYHLLLTKDLSEFSNRGNPPSIRKTTLEKWQIPLPPLPEQKRIATILDAADALRSKRRQSIAELDTLLQATFLDMFGDPVTNPKGWLDSQKLGEVADIVSGIAKGRKTKVNELREIPYLAVVNVQDKYLKLDHVKTIFATSQEIEKYQLEQNDLLLTEGGDPDKLGRGSIWRGELVECIHQNHVFRVRLETEEIHPIFLNWIVGSARGKMYFMRSAKQTTGIASVNMTQLKAFPLLVPPLELQREFAAIVESIEVQKARMQSHLQELDTLFAALQQRAFNGEL